SKAAEKWLEMSAFDDLKKKNKQTYQEIMYEMLELNKTKISKPIFNLSDVDIKKGNALTKKWKLSKKRPTIGLNVGVGTKWPSKGWTAKRWEELIEILNSKNYNLLLLGGQDEKTLMARLCRKYQFLINTGYNNSLVEFAAIVNLCDIIITADTLALHIGTALNKKIIALFGPTSISEINLFGCGIKITAPDDCKCYYNKSCSEEVSCMEKITSGMIMNAVCEIEKL
ncbi:MAG: glycosyltransferase family 9 protein, partial [Ignavibacteria bacterium]|nr:glycosyltransferase family 9 protein [Ignavibacteria bacterium]